MSSWLVHFFMNMKVNIAVEEVVSNEKETLNLSQSNIERFPASSLSHLYHSKVCRLLLQKNYLVELPAQFGLFLRKLELLTVAFNNLRELPPSFAVMENLTFLNISNNHFVSFPKSICALKNLRTLWANGIGVQEIPDDIEMLSELTLLGLRNNLLASISRGICGLVKLNWLTLSGNNIQSIPMEIQNLKSLVHLNLNFNQITTLPDIWSHMTMNADVEMEIRRLPKLKRAYLAGNLIMGTNDIYKESFIGPLDEVKNTASIINPGTETRATEDNLYLTSHSERSVSLPNVRTSANSLRNLFLQPKYISQTRLSPLISRNNTSTTGAMKTVIQTTQLPLHEEEAVDLLSNHIQMLTLPSENEILGRREEVLYRGCVSAPAIFMLPNSEAQNLNSMRNNFVAEENREPRNTPELPAFHVSWNFSQSTDTLDGNISSDDSDIEELPLDTIVTSVTAGLLGILTS